MKSSRSLCKVFGIIVLTLVIATFAMPASASDAAPENGFGSEIGLWTWLIDAFEGVTSWFAPTPVTSEGMAERTVAVGSTSVTTVAARPGPEVTQGETAEMMDPDG